MRFNRIALIVAAAACMGGVAVRGLFSAPQQQESLPGQGPVIRAETRLVLVDAVVTDKKGNYIRDLKAEDFKVWEDGKEQSILNCTYQQEPAEGANAKARYVMLVFDSVNLNPTDQMRLQQAATKFFDANSAPNRMMAVAEIRTSGARLIQNFTPDAQKLKQAVAAVAPLGTGTTQGMRAGSTMPGQTEQGISTSTVQRLGQRGSTIDIRSLLLSMGMLARKIEALPGRKTVVLFSTGFVVPPANSADENAMLDAYNRANAAIYPVDLGGLEGTVMDAGSGTARPRNFLPSSSPFVMQFRDSSRDAEPSGAESSEEAEASGGQAGGAGQGGQTGGAGQGSGGRTGTGGSTGNTGTILTAPRSGNDMTMPDMTPGLNLDSGGSRRVSLMKFAKETGGLMQTASNDLFGAVDKVRKEQDEYYLLSYSAPFSQDGSCHSLKVKVDRSGVVVRARTRYCNVRSPDLLAGTPVARQLDARLADPATGSAGASAKAAFFYSGKNTSRVTVAMEIPTSALSFSKEKNKSRSEINLLGVAYRSDGSVAARFSDSVKLELDKKQQEAFRQRPLLHYENQFEMAPGKYTLKLVFNSGAETYGRMETPLVIEPYEGDRLTLAALALSNDLRRIPPEGLGSSLVEDKVPLITQGTQMVPSGTNRFKATDNAALYTEVYDPLLTGATPPQVGVVLRVLDRKTGQEKDNSGLVKLTGQGPIESEKLTVGLVLPLKALGPGAYSVEVTAYDSVGNRTTARTVDMDVE